MYVLRFVGQTQDGIETTFRTDCADLHHVNEKLYPIVRQSSQAPHYTTPLHGFQEKQGWKYAWDR